MSARSGSRRWAEETGGERIQISDGSGTQQDTVVPEGCGRKAQELRFSLEAGWRHTQASKGWCRAVLPSATIFVSLPSVPAAAATAATAPADAANYSPGWSLESRRERAARQATPGTGQSAAPAGSYRARPMPWGGAGPAGNTHWRDQVVPRPTVQGVI